MNDVEIHDERFRYLAFGNASLEKLYSGMRWAEGPVYFADTGVLLWSDIPNNRMLRLAGDQVSVFRQPSQFSNGNTRDRQGRLITCEHGTRRVTRTEFDGTITVMAERYQGKRLNSPNDVVVRSDDSIWFTDPPYGIISDYEGYKADMEQAGCFVYRLDPKTGELSVVADDFVKPNGLCFSPDESTLYISDTGFSHDPEAPQHIRAFDVAGDKLTRGRVFAEMAPHFSDGFRADTEGNIWTSAGAGVNCYAPSGELLGRINVPELVANLAFGGTRRNRLFITATTSLYAIYVGANGAQTP
ncbi:MAG: SMP-30/gluconolactonase/LRE family protein [Trueperaceae bacterium]|nr:MAG: SMP-30/gluconolactonase/LRE family protein [Trueperaceae bacterium]